MSMPSSKPCWKSLSSLDSSCPSSKPRNCFFWDFHFPSTVFLIGQDEVLLVSKSGCQGLPRWLGGKESAYLCRRCRRHGFNPWVGKIPWRRAWQPTPVFLSGRSHGPRSLAGCSPWGRKELDTTEGLSLWTRSGCIGLWAPEDYILPSVMDPSALCPLCGQRQVHIPWVNQWINEQWVQRPSRAKSNATLSAAWISWWEGGSVWL